MEIENKQKEERKIWAENLVNSKIGNKIMLTMREVSDIVNVHPNTIRQWLKCGLLTGIVLPKQNYRINRESVVSIIADGVTTRNQKGIKQNY